VDAADIDEIVESHLKNGQVVERLRHAAGTWAADPLSIGFGMFLALARLDL
jgi:(2Fe-2S) ferredoxin